MRTPSPGRARRWPPHPIVVEEAAADFAGPVDVFRDRAGLGGEFWVAGWSTRGPSATRRRRSGRTARMAARVRRSVGSVEGEDHDWRRRAGGRRGSGGGPKSSQLHRWRDESVQSRLSGHVVLRARPPRPSRSGLAPRAAWYRRADAVWDLMSAVVERPIGAAAVVPHARRRGSRVPPGRSRLASGSCPAMRERSGSYSKNSTG